MREGKEKTERRRRKEGETPRRREECLRVMVRNGIAEERPLSWSEESRLPTSCLAVELHLVVARGATVSFCVI